MKKAGFFINADTIIGISYGPRRYVSTFVRACALFDASLNDRVTIHLDQGADVIGISLLAFPPHHGCSIRRPEDVDENLVAERLSQWSSEVGISHMTQVLNGLDDEGREKKIMNENQTTRYYLFYHPTCAKTIPLFIGSSTRHAYFCSKDGARGG